MSRDLLVATTFTFLSDANGACSAALRRASMS